MNLLVVNFEMDQDSFSMPWSVRVVNLLAERCDRIHVLTQRHGRTDCPPNVTIETMPCSRLIAVPALREVFFIWMRRRLRSLLERESIDACFVHMAAYWAAVFAPELKKAGIPVLVWYAHGSVTPELRRVVAAATRLVTSTPEGMRIPTEKLRVIGQGVDTDLFSPRPPEEVRHDLIAVTRISPRKRIDLLLEVFGRLLARAPAAPIRLKIAGAAVTRRDAAYEREIARRLKKCGLEDRVDLLGHVPQHRLPELHRNAFLHLHVSDTGSLDKTVLESLSCGCPVLTTAPACRELLASFPGLFSASDDPGHLAERVLHIHGGRDHYDPVALRRLVVGHHDDRHYVTEIMKNLDALRAERE